MLYFISDLSLSISSVYSNKTLRLVLFNHGHWASLNYKLHFNITKETKKYWESEYWCCLESSNNAKLLHEESGERKKVPERITWVRIDVCLTMGRKRNLKKESQGQSVPVCHLPQPSPLSPFHPLHPQNSTASLPLCLSKAEGGRRHPETTNLQELPQAF